MRCIRLIGEGSLTLRPSLPPTTERERGREREGERERERVTERDKERERRREEGGNVVGIHFSPQTEEVASWPIM